jgi:hypothetical protein
MNVAVFAHSLRDNTRLQQLSLDGKYFVPEGAKALLELMQDAPVHHGRGFINGRTSRGSYVSR